MFIIELGIFGNIHNAIPKHIALEVVCSTCLFEDLYSKVDLKTCNPACDHYFLYEIFESLRKLGECIIYTIYLPFPHFSVWEERDH